MQIKEVITGTEPLTLEEVKEYLKVTYTAEDDLITAQITQVRELAEKITARALVEKTITLFDEDACSPYLLPFPNHLQVDAVKVNGVDVDVVTEGLTQFYVLFNRVITNLYTRQSTLLVEYQTESYCPEGVKTAMLKTIADIYEYRGNKFEGSITQISTGSMMHLQPYIVAR